MDAKETFDMIEPHTLDTLLREYPNIVPAKLSGLDQQRYSVIPNALNEQDGASGLSKAQVACLVDWKLSHGKFRPTLKGLVQQNTDDVVEQVTGDAFGNFNKSDKEPKDAKQAIDTLTKLKGIGPATASLLLSVYDADNVPFFSDELFRWCFFDEGKGQGWDRDIKYNLKEYLELYVRVQAFKARFTDQFGRNVTAVEMEKVAYVLGKRPAGSVGNVSKAEKRKAADSKTESPPTKKAVVGSHKSTTETTAATSRPRRKAN